MARASTAMAVAMARQRVRLKAAAERRTWGKPVAARTLPLKRTPGPLMATPWRDSDHHWYGGMPRRGTAAAVLESCWIFSERERREIREVARVEMESDVLQKGKEEWGGRHG